MKARPILFNNDMVKAILSGNKTQTRRIIQPQPANGWGFETPPTLGRITSPNPKKNKFGVFIRRGTNTDFPEMNIVLSPYGQPGDLLYVRETFHYCGMGRVVYKSGLTPPDVYKWTPSIHMPRWASRLTLRITDVRVEQLQDISEEDALAEGVERSAWKYSCEPYRNYLHPCMAPGHNKSIARSSFMTLWQSINGPDSWNVNPWLWVVDFEVINKNVGDVLAIK